MRRDRPKQKNKGQSRGETGKDQSPPVVRSPALEAAERKRRGETESSRLQPGRAASARRVNYAVEEFLGPPITQRKSLPRSKVSKAGSGSIAPGLRQRTGLTAG